MKRQIIAIGGGGFGRNPGEGLIERYILDQSKKSKPKVCFIPTATGDDEGYKESYYSTFSMFDCDPVHLDFFKRTPDLEQLILNQELSVYQIQPPLFLYFYIPCTKQQYHTYIFNIYTIPLLNKHIQLH